jgi:arginyl-tRNA synthetase
VTPTELAEVITSAVKDAVDAGELSVTPPQSVTVERPRVREHGDYASNIAMQLAKEAKLPPRAIANVLVGRLSRAKGVTNIDIAGPGFLNFTLEAAAQGEIVRTIVDAGQAYGRTDTFAGLKVNLEFVSANPTGPIHIGGVRWAVVGDVLARVLAAANADITREYYFNDAGVQIDLFARSLLAVAKGARLPEDGYSGSYIGEIADAVQALRPDVLRLPDSAAQEVFRVEGIALMFEEVKQSLEKFGVHFDVFFNEKALHERGELDAALKRLRDQGHVFERDGAVWLRTTDFGDDKDRVLVKSDGSWTYFAADCAYYLDKRERGFEKVIIILGADHHGYIGRMKAMVACFGDDPENNLEILIGQLVSLIKGGQPVRMSKRAGTVLTLEDLVEAVGVDAARYALARASVDSPIDLDVDLLTTRSNENPVYYVQYAHTRMAGVGRNAAELGIDKGARADFRPELLNLEQETELLALLGEFPRIVAVAAELREVHRVARYLEELAGVYHRFYSACRILPIAGEPATDLNRARLWLTEATQTVLRNGLQLLGVSAPERM